MNDAANRSNSHALVDFITAIDEKNRAGCMRFYEDYKDRINAAPGSFMKHQAWEGGYVGHLEEAMCIARAMYGSLEAIRPLPFSLPDAYLAIFWHDAEKIFKYTEPKKTFESDEKKLAFIFGLMKEYDISVTDDVRNAMLYVHGEGNMYSPFENVQRPLAAFVHCCDTISARVWPDHPKKARECDTI